MDDDGDGHGFQCEQGDDCDDTDPAIFEGCRACAHPSDGCACDTTTAPVECTLPKEISAEGALLCKSGTRYCRDSKWSACEGIVSFTAPPPSRLLTNALIDSDAGAVICSSCRPDCYQLADPLSTAGDGGALPGSNVTFQTLQGITLTGFANDAALPQSGDIVDIVPPCNPVTDTDCDGVPNTLDPYPAAKPFATPYSTIFMDLAPGQSGSNTFKLSFYVNTADIYFLIDMTGSMSEEKSALFTSLRSGNFLDNPATTADESIDPNIVPAGCPTALKTQGVLGNISCLMNDSGFGLGWYREIPFSASDNYGIKYSYPDFEPFEHRQDISVNPALTSSALDLLYTRGNQNWSEAATVALSAVATGGPIYMGWNRPGIPPKVCPSGRWGYPCFRDSAIPIVVLITDAPMMNGPVPAQGHLGNENSSYSYGGTSNLQPVNYQPNGLRYTSLASDSAYHPVSGNESFTSAYDVGVVDSSFKTYTGDTRGMTADIYATNLGITCPSGTWPSGASSVTSPGYPDAVFKFTVQNTKTLTVSTRGTRHQPSLAIIPATAVSGRTTVTANGSNYDAAGAHPQNLTALGPTINLQISGDTSLAAYATGDFPTYAMKECFRGTGGDTLAPDAVYTFTVTQDLPSVTFSANGSDFEAVLALYDTLPTGMSNYALNNTNDKFWDLGAALPTGTTTAATAAVPGTLDGRAVWLRAGDTSSLANHYATTFYTNVSGDTTCDSVLGAARDVVVDFKLASPRTISIESTDDIDSTDSAAFDHVIALVTRPASSSSSAPSVASYCNKDGQGAGRGSLSQSLAAGTYSLVLRGEQLTTTARTRRRGGGTTMEDKGGYGLILSDSSVQPRACHNEAAASSFTTSLRAGVTYYLVVRGRSISSSAGYGSGPYTINISNVPAATGATCAYNNTSYAGGSGDSTFNPHAAEVTQTFAPGDYYAVLKGNANNANWDPMPPTSDTARGWYQLTIGDPTLATNNQTATMPQWGNATSGVLSQLQQHNIRVINVTSTIAVSGYSGGASNQNTALQQQADIISLATGATSTAGAALRFDIKNNGTGMGYAVVDAINKMAHNLAMDVSVRFVPSPDMPAAPSAFVFRSRAVGSVPGCEPPVDTNSDGVVDTYYNCFPGSKPVFEVTFTNPPATSPLSTSKHVRLNGTKGGYDMRLELVGDGQYVVDSIPVYIIPEDVVDDPPNYLYNASGLYTQDVAAAYCVGTERPTWTSLSWDATLPAGTSLSWRACAGNSVAELDACVSASNWQLIADVYPGAACFGSADCPNGYCNGDGVCEYPERPSCSANDDCGSNGSCVANTCVWTANPIDVKPAFARGFNGMKHVRLQLQLNASPSRSRAPSVAGLQLNYVCAPGE